MGLQELLTPKEVAQYLKVAEKTLEGWRTAGKGPKYYRPHANAVRYARADIETWLKVSTEDALSGSATTKAAA